MSGRKAFLLRISADLHQELEAWAQEDLRSVNGQIEFLLRKAVQQRRKPAGADTAGPPPSPDPAWPNRTIVG